MTATKQQKLCGDLNEVFNDSEKQGLLYVAIVGLIEKASIENWASNEKLYNAAVKLVEIRKDLMEDLEELQ